MLERFVRGEQGASMTEYALLLVMIALAAVAAVAVLGTQVSTAYDNASSEMAAHGWAP